MMKTPKNGYPRNHLTSPLKLNPKSQVWEIAYPKLWEIANPKLWEIANPLSNNLSNFDFFSTKFLIL